MVKRRKNPHAVALGKLATAGRMKRMTPEQRSKVGKIAIAARWAKHRAKTEGPPA
jgi:hypothetical protein